MGDTLLERYVLAGGPIMALLVPCAVLAIAYAIQGFVNLRAARISPPGFVGRLWKARSAEGAKEIERLLDTEGRTHALGRIVRNTLAAKQSSPTADTAVLLREQIADEADQLLHLNSQLNVLYRLTPLLGLVGTVIGMIKAFMEFSISPEPRIENLAAGVMTALLATGWGISIACFSLMFYAIHQRRIEYLERFVFIEQGELALHAALGEPVGLSAQSARDSGLAEPTP